MTVLMGLFIGVLSFFAGYHFRTSDFEIQLKEHNHEEYMRGWNDCADHYDELLGVAKKPKADDFLEVMEDVFEEEG